ncbi:MAG: hypothetical protein OEZ43_18045 [Gammaproteobacteria bacterium]|nr:hypothetical protein [Gammaproteobacteria bacterium]
MLHPGKCDRRAKIFWSAPAILLQLFFLFCTSGTVVAQTLVANTDVPVVKLDRNFVRSIFLMRIREWSDGKPITVFVLEGKEAIHREFCSEVLEMFPYQLQQRWDRLVFSGTGQAPFFVKDEAELLKKIRNTSGSIGYIAREMVDEKIKVISVDSESL